MNITDVRVRKVTKEGKMKAVVSITIDDEFVVHDIKVIEGEKGLFIAMPSRKATDRGVPRYRTSDQLRNQRKNSTIILKQYEQARQKRKQRKLLQRPEQKEEKMPPGGKRSGYVFCPGAFLSVKIKMTIYKSIRHLFMRGEIVSGLSTIRDLL